MMDCVCQRGDFCPVCNPGEWYLLSMKWRDGRDALRKQLTEVEDSREVMRADFERRFQVRQEMLEDVQVAAAAYRQALEYEDKWGLGPAYVELKHRALSSHTAGQELLSRMQKLERVAEAARTWTKDMHLESKCDCGLCAVKEALAALDGEGA